MSRTDPMISAGGEDAVLAARCIYWRAFRRVALVTMAVLVVAGPIGCQPPSPKPEPELQARIVDPPAPSPTPRRDPAIYLVLRVKERRLYLMKDGTAAPVASFPIAVGRAGHETPTGEFQVEEKIVDPDFDRIDPDDRTRVLEHFPPGPKNPLGERWIGIAHGEGWSLGIHGTPHPELLGKAVSGGCLRMRNADVIRIYDAVELGTKVIVHP